MRNSSDRNILSKHLRRIEHLLGARRDERSLWPWVVPFATVIIVFTMLLGLGLANGSGVVVTVIMSLVLSLFMGVMSAIYLTAASGDEN